MERFLNFFITMFPLDSENVLRTSIFNSNYIIHILSINMSLALNNDSHEILIEIMLHPSNDALAHLNALPITLGNTELNMMMNQ